MIKYILSKELFYACLCTVFIYTIFKKFNLSVISPSNENMENVSYQFDDINTI